MTLWSRAIFGALIGAILTLLIHPSSRPYLAGPFVETSNLIQGPQYAPLPTSFPTTLPAPNDNVSASLWIHVGAEQLRNRSGLSQEKIEGLIKIARTRGKEDVTNSFWKMAEAVFLDRLGKKDEAVKVWTEAARGRSYDDYQSAYLSSLREDLARQTASNTWQFAYCYRLRSLSFAEMVESFARNLVSSVSRDKKEDLLLRYNTLLNGSLLRSGARNLAIMHHGVAIVEFASHPQGLQNDTSIKRLLIAHSEFKEALRGHQLTDAAESLDNLYNTNDGWSALTKREDPAEKVENLTLFGAIWPNLPGVLLQCSLVGGIIWLVGLGLEKLTKGRYRYAVIASLGIAVTLSLSVWLLTQSWLAFFATALCCLFILLSPKSVRSQMPQDVGPLFVCAVFSIAFVFVFLTGIMFLTRTLPVVASVSAFNPQFQTIVDFKLAAGLSLLMLACLYLFAPLWGMAQHVKTQYILARGFRTFGAIVGTLSLILSIAATPICVYYESENQETFVKLLTNEPLYYYAQ